MKYSLIILVLLLSAACAPLQDGSQPAQIIPPTIPANDTSITILIDPGTSLPLCPCPSGLLPPGASQGGATGETPVICNCPASLIPPVITSADIAPTSQAIQTNKITLDDNGKTITLHPGESVLLDLGTDMFNWTVDIDDQNVLSRLKNVMVIRGAQGIYEAYDPGHAVLTAVGDPLCRDAVPACMAPSILFKIIVIVQ